MICSICNEEAEVWDAEFGMLIGLVVGRIQQVKRGRMCSHCLKHTFWVYTLTTLLLGWWGIFSFFGTPIVVILNIITLYSHFFASPYPEDPLPVTLSKSLATRLESFRDEIFQRLFKGEALQQVAEDIGRRIGASAEEVMAFYNNTYMIVSDERRNLLPQAIQSPQQSGAADRPPETDSSSHGKVTP